MTRYLLAIPRDGYGVALADQDLSAASKKLGRPLRHLRLRAGHLFLAGDDVYRSANGQSVTLSAFDLAGHRRDAVDGHDRILSDRRPTVLPAGSAHVDYRYDPGLRRHRIFRDPSGHVGCYHYVDAGHDIFMSDLDMARALRGTHFAIDDRALVRALSFPVYRNVKTAVAGVTEVLPGHAMVLEPGSMTIEPCWSPWNYTDRGDALDEPTRLREVIISAVEVAVRARSQVLLELSGGLDSSILAACLHQLGVRFSVVTYVPFGPKGDERRFADAVAQAYGCASFVRYPSASSIDPTRSGAAHLARPSARCFTQEFDRLGVELAREIGADLILNGGAGDGVLGYFSSAAPAVDRWRSEGPSWGLVETVRDIASARGVAPSTVTWAAIRQIPKRSSARQQEPDLSFLVTSTTERIAPIYHPWLGRADVRLPGKLSQIRSLAGIYGHLEGTTRGLEVSLIYPFMMQPVLETALSIPSWRSCAGGRDRAVARAAFAADLPDLVRLRRSKGTFDGLTFDIFHHHRTTIADMLLDGHLSRMRIVDRNAIAAYFSRQAIPQSRDLNRLMALVDCEAWIDATNSAARRAD